MSTQVTEEEVFTWRSTERELD